MALKHKVVDRKLALLSGIIDCGRLMAYSVSQLAERIPREPLGKEESDAKAIDGALLQESIQLGHAQMINVLLLSQSGWSVCKVAFFFACCLSLCLRLSGGAGRDDNETTAASD